MGVPVSTLSVGRCFVTSADQVRHIMEINGTDVVYQARGKKNQSFPWGPKTTVDQQKFADDVEREVPCHYDPDFS